MEMLNKILGDRKSHKYLLCFFLCGVLLMVFPTKGEAVEQDTVRKDEVYSLEAEEKRLEDVLSSVQGVGKCKVLLSVATGAECVLAEDNGETVVVKNGNQEIPITVVTKYPRYQGAVILIGGYSNANVRFDILSAVMAYTGLGSDKITICPMKQ